MSWTKKNVHPGKIVSTSQEVEVVVLDVDPSKRRVSLGLKQAMANPWDAFVAAHPIGSTVEGEVKNATEFGLFIGLERHRRHGHLSDLLVGPRSHRRYTKGDVVKARCWTSMSSERISSAQQLAGDRSPTAVVTDKIAKGSVVTCTVSQRRRRRSPVAGEAGFIRTNSPAIAATAPDRFAPGEKGDAKVTQVDAKTRRLTLSIKALEVEEEKKAMAEFGSSDSCASLGDILGAALQEKKAKAAAKKKTDDDDAKPKKAKKAKKDDADE